MEHYFTDNTNLKSEVRTLNYSYGNVSFSFYSDNGVFAKNKIDYGSSFLVEVFFQKKKNKINSLLDVGCGYGFIGIVLGKVLNIGVDLVDVNKRALHLAQRNGKENEVVVNAFRSDGYSNVVGKYDVIVSNPPIRAGKGIVLEILIGAKEHLENDGQLWFVMRKDQGVKSIIKALDEHYLVEIMDKSNGFFVVMAKKR